MTAQAQVAPRIGRRRGIGIPRVSKVGGREGDAFRSPSNQWDDIGALAHRKGIDLLNIRDADIDVSGTTMQRRALRNGIEAIGQRQAEVLVFAKLDRYARTTLGGLQTLDEVEALGGSLYFGDLDVDTATPTGRQIFTIMLSNAEREVTEKAIELARNARNATLRGVAIAPLLPGYRKNEETRCVEVDERYAPLIPQLYERRASGEGWSSLRRWWHSETGEWLKLGRFRTMIESRLYRGELRYGDAVSDVRHPSLVDERLWKDAQSMPAARPSRSKSSPSLLAGIAVCSGCGHPMTASTAKRGTVPIYRCQSRGRPGWTCERPVTITRDILDAYVVERFLEWAGAATVVTTDDQSEDFARADDAIRAAEDELRRYLEVTSTVDVSVAKEGAERRQDALNAARAERQRLEETRVVAGIRYRVDSMWPELDIDEKRQLLRAGIRRVVVHPALTTERGGRARTPIAERVPVIDWRSD